MYSSANVEEGVLTKEGYYQIKYKSHGVYYDKNGNDIPLSELENTEYAITLKKVGNSYQVIKNQRADEVDFTIQENEEKTEDINEETKKDEGPDETKAPGKLPQTGKNTAIITVISLLLIGSLVFFIGYKRNNN